MAPEIKYAQNLKVLKRADPSIESIVDQFPHVCIYQYDFAAHKWDKRGYEGSFFIFERYEHLPLRLYVPRILIMCIDERTLHMDSSS